MLHDDILPANNTYVMCGKRLFKNAINGLIFEFNGSC